MNITTVCSHLSVHSKCSAQRAMLYAGSSTSEFLLWRIRKGSSLFTFFFYFFFIFHFPLGSLGLILTWGGSNRIPPLHRWGNPHLPHPHFMGVPLQGRYQSILVFSRGYRHYPIIYYSVNAFCSNTQNQIISLKAT